MYVNVNAFAVKFAPPKLIAVFTVALRLESEPFVITIPGALELPSTRLKSRPFPKFNPALP